MRIFAAIAFITQLSAADEEYPDGTFAPDHTFVSEGEKTQQINALFVVADKDQDGKLARYELVRYEGDNSKIKYDGTSLDEPASKITSVAACAHSFY
jgi:hypothetical protein